MPWLVHTAKALPDFGKRLHLFAARHSPSEEAIRQYRATLTSLLKSKNRNPSKRAREARQHFDELIEGLRAEFAAGRTDVVMAICAEAVVLLTEYGTANADPQGRLGPVIPELSRLHLESAMEARPAGPLLAEQLVDLGQASAASGAFRDAAFVYRDILGDSGLTAYRSFMEPHWERLQSTGRLPLASRTQTKEQMLSWARAEEDPLVRAGKLGAIRLTLAKTAAEFLLAAESLFRAKEFAAALAALDQGIQLGLKGPCAEETLIDLTALALEHSSEESALDVAWRVFSHRPGDSTYTLLHQAASTLKRAEEYLERARLRCQELGLRWVPPE